MVARQTAQVGSRVTFRKTMTVAEQAMFTGISGNLAPLYVDATKARASGAPGMIAFELAVAGLATTCLWRLGGADYRLNALNLEFVAPVPVGGSVEASAEIIAVEGDRLRCRICCTLDLSGTVIEGEAILAPYSRKG